MNLTKLLATLEAIEAIPWPGIVAKAKLDAEIGAMTEAQIGDDIAATMARHWRTGGAIRPADAGELFDLLGWLADAGLVRLGPPATPRRA